MSGPGEDSAEKSHAPTERRLTDARRRGDIPLSADLVSAAAWGGLALTAHAFGALVLLGLGATLAQAIGQADVLAAAIFDGGARAVLGPWVVALVLAAGPLVLAPAIGALVALFAQRAPAFAPSRIEPKLSRLDLFKNLRQKFGGDGLAQFFKGLARLLVISLLLGAYVMAQSEQIFGAARLQPMVALPVLGRLLLGLLTMIWIVAMAFALLDLVWQRLSFLRRNRMSRKELMDEQKDSEGDPHLRQRRRARAAEIATAPLRKSMAEAAVVIVNPTHYAVALAWDSGSRRAPRCVCKGVDEVAASMRALAAELGVPVRSDPPTARALYADVAVGQEIEARHFRAVAAAIRFAEEMRRRAARRSPQ